MASAAPHNRSPFSGGNDLLAELAGRLEAHPCPLILDNLEQLLDPDGVTIGLIERLLARTSRATALVTCRRSRQMARRPRPCVRSQAWPHTRR